VRAPTSGSWLNLVEVIFSTITGQVIRRGSFDSVKALTTAIRTLIDGYTGRCQPFLGAETPDEILAPRHPVKRTPDANTSRCTCQAIR
jgi:hypothetical protein